MKSLRDLSRKYAPKSAILRRQIASKAAEWHRKYEAQARTAFLWTIIFLCNIVFLTRSYFGTSKGNTYLKGESLESTNIDSKFDTIIIAAAVTFATQVVFSALRMKKLKNYLIYNYSKCDFVVIDDMPKEHLITNKMAFVRVNSRLKNSQDRFEQYLFLYKGYQVTPELIPMKPSKMRMLDEVLKTSALQASADPHRTLTNKEYKWIQEFTNHIPEVEIIRDKSNWHKYTGIGVGAYLSFISYANLPFACLSAFLGTIKSLESIYDNVADASISLAAIIAYGIQNMSFNVPQGVDNANALAKSIREGTFNPKKSHVAITFTFTFLSILATMGFYILGVEGLPSVPLLNYFFQTPGSILAARIAAGWVGLFYPIIVQLPATYEWVSKSKPVVFPDRKSALLQSLTFGLLANPYKLKHYSIGTYGFVDAVGGGFANAYGIASFIANRMGGNAYNPGYTFLNSLVIVSSTIMVLQFNAVGPSKDSIPKILVIDFKDPKIMTQIIRSDGFISRQVDLRLVSALNLPTDYVNYPTDVLSRIRVLDFNHPDLADAIPPGKEENPYLLCGKMDAVTNPKKIRLLDAKPSASEIKQSEHSSITLERKNETTFTIIDDWYRTDEDDNEYLAQEKRTWRECATSPDFKIVPSSISSEVKSANQETNKWQSVQSSVKKENINSDTLFNGLKIHTAPVIQNGNQAVPQKKGFLNYKSGQPKMNGHSQRFTHSFGKKHTPQEEKTTELTPILSKSFGKSDTYTQ